ncbi:MAG TPA: peptidylprolyl isomerase [Steroidobacteraceae bacterium]|nr:peptidylprolyl isomerase [Steroidobacteraceae bacterium]
MERLIRPRRFAAFTALALVTLACVAQEVTAQRPPTPQSVLAAAKPSDWQALDPQDTLYLQLPAGRVIIALAPQFAPGYVANIKRLVRAGYFNGLAIVRVQDDFVAQWGDPDQHRSLGGAERSIPAEFIVAARDVPFTPLPDPDTYAPEVGFSDGFPAARDPKLGRVWLVHCYGMIGAARADDVDSGNGSELYAVIGQAPRQLDRNDALVGRVVEGMELLSALPRGSGPLGFYARPSERVPIVAARIAADVPPAERVPLEVLRTDTQTFAELVEAERDRRDAWYKVPAGRVGVCNVPLPARIAQKR